MDTDIHIPEKGVEGSWEKLRRSLLDRGDSFLYKMIYASSVYCEVYISIITYRYMCLI